MIIQLDNENIIPSEFTKELHIIFPGAQITLKGDYKNNIYTVCEINVEDNASNSNLFSNALAAHDPENARKEVAIISIREERNKRLQVYDSYVLRRLDGKITLTAEEITESDNYRLSLLDLPAQITTLNYNAPPWPDKPSFFHPND